MLSAGEGNSTTPPTAGFPVTACGWVPPTAPGGPLNVNAGSPGVAEVFVPDTALEAKPPVASEAEETIGVDRLRLPPNANGARAGDRGSTLRAPALSPGAGVGMVLARVSMPEVPHAEAGAAALESMPSVGLGVGVTSAPPKTPVEWAPIDEAVIGEMLPSLRGGSSAPALSWPWLCCSWSCVEQKMSARNVSFKHGGPTESEATTTGYNRAKI